MTGPDQKSIAIVGCGWLGTALGLRLRNDFRARGESATIIATTTTPARTTELEKLGFLPKVVRAEDVEQLRDAIAPCETVFLLVAAGRSRGQSYEQVYVGGARALAEVLSDTDVGTIIYTSSTSVYAQDDGSWVDEASPAEPTSDNGRALLAAEQILLTEGERLGRSVTVLRLAGTYADDRGPQRFLDRFAGTVRENGDAYLNLVHRDDIVQALTRFAANPQHGVFNLADDVPTSRRDFYSPLLRQAGLPPIQWRDSTDACGRGKRVSNARIKKALGLVLKHPTH